MNRLRELAKDCEYVQVGPPRWIVDLKRSRCYDIDKAPPECFADEPAEEPVREGGRVVVNRCCRVPSTGASSGDEVYAGRHGTVATITRDIITAELDDGTIRNFWAINLRRERPDERPAEPKPEPLRANFPPPQYHGGFPVLPIAEKKPPERKYEDGQWVTFGHGQGGRILCACLHGSGFWLYGIRCPGGADSAAFEGCLSPCPPPLSDAQRRLLPGDKVRVIDIPVGPDGIPCRGVWHDASNTARPILSIDKDSAGVFARVVDFGGVVYRYHLWNLEPAEEK